MLLLPGIAYWYAPPPRPLSSLGLLSLVSRFRRTVLFPAPGWEVSVFGSGVECCAHRVH